MITNESNPLWVERYRPKTVHDTILPSQLKITLQQFVDNKQIPNLILAGGPGVGKTTAARAMLEELGCEYIVINGSLHGNIDTLRTDIKQFASSVSIFNEGRKYVILDEADHLTPMTQPALRNFMEEFSKNCGFILTCNYKTKIIEPLHSRCSVIEFKIPASEKVNLASQFFKRACAILDIEKVKYDKKVVAEVINKFFPDWRRCLNELQRYSATGSIDTGIFANFQEAAFKDLVQHMKNKDFTKIRKWVNDNSDMDSNEIFTTFYETAATYVEKEYVPALILILAKYQYQSSFCANPEINTTACLVEILTQIKFKA